MDFPETEFIIVEDYYCPLYQLGDRFSLSGRSFMTPPGKATCMVLANDIEANYQEDDVPPDKRFPPRIDCSGPYTDCIGVIRMEAKTGYRIKGTTLSREKEEKLRKIMGVLSQFPIFKGLNEGQLRELVSVLKFKHFPKDRIVVKKGAPGVNLFVIVSGKVVVQDSDNMPLAKLEKGEVFGEMSLISGDPVGATVKVLEPANLLYIRGKDFGQMLNQFPSVQMYFAKLLTRRLSDTNIARARELAAGMTGKLAEIPPSELFQTFNVNQKTGALDLNLSKGDGRVCFRQGELIIAKYGEFSGVEAFFEILKENSGRFKFSSAELRPEEERMEPLGDFMWLLMEGIRKIDESKADA